jgi:endonuclease I
MMVARPPAKLLPYRRARKAFLSWYEEPACPTIEHKVTAPRTIEHVVPQSLYHAKHPDLAGDMHNFIVYPGKLNNRRSNFRMTDRIPMTSVVNVLDKNGDVTSIKTHKDLRGRSAFCYMGNFVPLSKHRGRISRCIAYFVNTYPEYADDVFSKVIDPSIVVLWYHMYPISTWEARLNKHIQQVQGNENPFVTCPAAIHECFGKYVNMSMFKGFDYSTHLTNADEMHNIRESITSYFERLDPQFHP